MIQNMSHFVGLSKDSFDMGKKEFFTKGLINHRDLLTTNKFMKS